MAEILDWSAGEWTNPPADITEDEGLLVTAVEGSDAWRHTFYGFVQDSEHALLAPLAVGEAMEVDFALNYDQQFDQAGVFVRVHDESWVKAGVEFSDGAAHLGAVVTNPRSDWSLAPVSQWLGKQVRVRVSRHDDALVIRATCVKNAEHIVQPSQMQLVRVVPFECDEPMFAGPYLCSPSRAGLQVLFHRWVRDEADSSLH